MDFAFDNGGGFTIYYEGGDVYLSALGITEGDSKFSIALRKLAQSLTSRYNTDVSSYQSHRRSST